MVNFAQQIADRTNRLIEEYPKYSDAEKKEYWNNIFYKQDRINGESGNGKLKISDFRNNYVKEDSIEKYALYFVDWYNDAFGMSDNEYEIQDLFILDEQAKDHMAKSLQDKATGENISDILDGE